MNQRNQTQESSFWFWVLILVLWLFSILIDRLWWNFVSGVPSWDQADYLNSALEHGRALTFLELGKWDGFKSFLDLSPKIPPLASIINGSIMGITGDEPYKAAWSLSIWNGLLLFSVAFWGLYLSGKKLSVISVILLISAPFLLQLRTDYVLELPLISLTTLSLFQYGRWCDPSIGNKWRNLIISSFCWSASLLVKQSAILVFLPALLCAFYLSFRRDKEYKIQFLIGCLITLISFLPWLHHNWIMTIGGTYRAVFESAVIEGDPSIFKVESILWYLSFLIKHIGPSIFYIGIGGCILLIIQKYRSKSFDLYNFSNKLNNFRWTWVGLNFFMIYIITSLVPNKDPRYIAPAIPLLILILSRGWLECYLWVNKFFRNRFNSKVLLLGFIPLISNLVPIIERFEKNELFNKREPNVQKIINSVYEGDPFTTKETLIVVPSTPDLNQHNVSFYGRRGGKQILGRQLGNHLSDIKPVLTQAKWIILAEGNNGSVRKNSLALDSEIRKSGIFYEFRRFPRKNNESYSLWRRKNDASQPLLFYKDFVSLARGMEQGPVGVKKIFDEIEVQHMLDAHYIYKDYVTEKAIKILDSNPMDIDSRWSMALISILSNRPNDADKHLKVLESILTENPWPSAYRIIVNLADWNPWKASRIAHLANSRTQNDVLEGLGDLSRVLGGGIWRTPLLVKSLPKAIALIEEDTKVRKSDMP